MMGYQSGDDGVSGRGGVRTLMSHQSEIRHSLISEVLMNKIAL